jgi:hypothetical protein
MPCGGPTTRILPRLHCAAQTPASMIHGDVGIRATRTFPCPCARSVVRARVARALAPPRAHLVFANRVFRAARRVASSSAAWPSQRLFGAASAGMRASLRWLAAWLALAQSDSSAASPARPSGQQTLGRDVHAHRTSDVRVDVGDDGEALRAVCARATGGTLRRGSAHFSAHLGPRRTHARGLD